MVHPEVMEHRMLCFMGCCGVSGRFGARKGWRREVGGTSDAVAYWVQTKKYPIARGVAHGRGGTYRGVDGWVGVGGVGSSDAVLYRML